MELDSREQARLKKMAEHPCDTSGYINLGPGPAWLHDAAIEKCAKIAESKMSCGCGRPDCYTDRIPEGIAKEIRALLSTSETKLSGSP